MAASLECHLPKIKAPLGGEKVYKDECVYSFDTPESDTGLYVCMSTFLGLGRKHVDRHYRKTGHGVFLHLRRIKREVPKPEDDPPKKKPTKLAIGVEGGFDVDENKYEYENINSVVILPEWTVVSLPNNELPDIVQLSAAAIIAADSAAASEEAEALAGTWEGEKRKVSVHAENLVQLDNGKKIAPRGWKCEQCDLTQNLWLNLTDGSILCGRRFWDGTGGNNHALDSYQKTGYPLAVKLGTITPDGADVFSYSEDDMVEDPDLDKHLAHFGINITALEKTDKTMLELEIDLNQKIGEWDVIQEAGSQLTPLYGPGYTGIVNLGNSCYMNSVMQVLFTLPDFQERYVVIADSIFDNGPSNSSADFSVQMAKFGQGLLSGEYSKPLPADSAGDNHIVPQQGIKPQMFKFLIGRGHPEFSTKRQQDAQEFFLHMASLIEKNSRGTRNPMDSFRFQVEERIQCVQSSKVKYTHRDDYILALPVPMETAINKDEVAAYEAKKQALESEGKRIDAKELVRPRITLAACLQAFSAEESVDDFYSTALQAKSLASKRTRLSTFPDYLMIQLKKFTIGDDWVPKKLDVSVDVPDEINLSALRGAGLQPGEAELPDEKPEQPQEVQIDESVVMEVMAMGFPLQACRKAVYHTRNTGIEAAMNWVMEHIDDPDFSAPLEIPKTTSTSSSFKANEESVGMLMSMGFTRPQAERALKETDNNLERAADWIFSHAGELDAEMTEESGSSTPSTTYRDGSGKYKLVAFISHMGTSTMVGHYVCHILKDGRWVIFNDEKVALSEKPPKDLAYMYLYQRV